MKLRLKIKDLPRDFNEFNRIKSIGFSDKKLSELTKPLKILLDVKEWLLKYYLYLRK